ncbi:MAG: MFS transporter, partial [Pantoea sp.]|nr:MFS transporter [Pantoea sp.]
SYAIFGGLTPICVSLLMNVSVMAPCWYVMALALAGLVTGIWLRRDISHAPGLPEAVKQA